MNTYDFEVMLVGSVVAVACAIPGVFLVLRRIAMMSDAISHTVLLGIVLVFFATGDIESPLLVFGAAAMGLITVSLVELLGRTKLVKQDAAIGLVFPALFSLAVILISRYAGDVHLDSDAVLLGELGLAPLNRTVFLGIDMPHALSLMSIILVLNVLFIALFYKELKLSTFDVGLAAALGFSPALVHYGLMALVSVTAVGAFDAVGAILVVALMIAPAASSYLLTDNLNWMLILSALFGVLSAILGYQLALALDANIAGSMATMTGLIFFTVFLLAPQRGMVAVYLRRNRQRWEFAHAALAIHLLQHEGEPEYVEEARIEHLSEHMHWDHDFAEQVVRGAQRNGLVLRRDTQLYLTDNGRLLAQEMLTN